LSYAKAAPQESFPGNCPFKVHIDQQHPEQKQGEDGDINKGFFEELKDSFSPGHLHFRYRVD